MDDIEYKGKTLKFTQDPYLDGFCDDEEDYYTATAIDDDGNFYEVVWGDILYRDTGGGEDEVNWESYTIRAC